MQYRYLKYNTKRRILHLASVICFVFFSIDCHAQSVDPKAAFEAFRKQTQESYYSFREQCMQDYVDFVRKAWVSFEGEEPIPVPKDDMLPPIVKPDDDKEQQKPKPIVIEEVVAPLPILPQPEPIEPIKETPKPEEKKLKFLFFGTNATVRYDVNKNITLNAVSSNGVADALSLLGDGRCDNLLYDCLALRDDHNLCDWAYLMMLKELACSIYGKDNNESVLLTAYLYMQSGYRMRLAEYQNRLYLLFASEFVIYNRVRYNIDGINYYGMYELPDQLNISLASFPKENNMSMFINAVQIFDDDMSDECERSSIRYPDVKATIAVNRNWLAFCSTYPPSMIGDNIVSRWAMYANTPMGVEVSNQLYSQLRPLISGKTQLEAVNILLNWVQTGFQYEYDDKVWGHDRAFFAEESLYYPYCDCEDRSILFTRLVRDLMGLKCILVFYPGHLATAVCFDEDVSGDYIMLNGQKYIVSDPTYIGAPVGKTMPNMNNKSAKVILLK